jgi:hypothetical protein
MQEVELLLKKGRGPVIGLAGTGPRVVRQTNAHIFSGVNAVTEYRGMQSL